MTWCASVRITGMLPSGEITGVQLTALDLVSDDHEFGLRQALVRERSPVTDRRIYVWYPILHAESQRLIQRLKGGSV